MPENRSRGQFAKGESGNPGGRPKGLAALVRAATAEGKDLVTLYVGVMSGELLVPYLTKAGAVQLPANHHDRMTAAAWLADRGFGKSPEKMELTGEDGSPLTIEIHKLLLPGAGPLSPASPASRERTAPSSTGGA